jgi:AcrR family transcriptional regulator
MKRNRTQEKQGLALTLPLESIILTIKSMTTKSTKSSGGILETPPARRDRSEQKLETRRRILDAAARVFGREGIAKATSSAIAEEAGVAHGSVFARFGSQEALLVAAIEDYGESTAKRIHEMIDAGAGTREVLDAHLAAIGEREDFYARLVAESGTLPSAARDSLVLMQSAIAFHLAPALEADRKAGRIKDMSLPLAFNTWLGLLHYYLANRELFAPGASVIELRGAQLAEHFMNLISKE